ncbi:MAG: cytochrome-c peroxidase [Deltaproteobacteria bacterium]|nr:MAG: cytochrome-c peroxidase [Deltaproteobacteria bacterium]
MTRSISLALLLAACNGTSTPSPSPDEGEKAEQAKEAPSEPDPLLLSMFKPLPSDMATEKRPITDAKVDLGRMLYYEPRLSKNHDISCNSCHMLDKWGVDNEKTSPGHKGQRGDRNSPTVYNAALHVAQFWDGRAEDVEEQAKGPILNPVEMAMLDEPTVLATLSSIPDYKEKFTAAFPDDDDPISYENLAIAIGAFERTLVTPSKWDDYLKGDASALTEAEVEGAKLFVQTGCTTCHLGENLGGSMFQKVGLVKPYETDDRGRYEVTEKESDKYVFKVPSLRNIAKTAPYFHDGSVESLPEAVKLMATHQLGKELADEDVDKIIVFLNVLTGDIPEDHIAKPDLPESGPDTPKPDPS